MAKVTPTWGIDIGQCAIKALRCVASEDEPGKMVAEAFDYIEYPKILSQPEAEPEEIIRDALKVFLSRNDIRGTKVAVSVSGQSGLARFIKLPPVEVKKIPDIVRYEANQQIPFDLEDVIWDFQRMFGGMEEEGFALDAEIGLFAMKRDQVFQEIVPYQEAGIDIDIVQLTPLAIYNFIAFDQIDPEVWSSGYDTDDPPESVIVLSIGTESTDLVITNGFRVWQRNQDESSESIVLTATPLRSTTTSLTPGFNTPSSDNDAIRKLHAIQSAMASQEKRKGIFLT